MAIKIIVQFICKFRHANSQRSGKALFFRLNGDYLNLKIELKKSFLSLEARTMVENAMLDATNSLQCFLTLRDSIKAPLYNGINLNVIASCSICRVGMGGFAELI